MEKCHGVGGVEMRHHGKPLIASCLLVPVYLILDMLTAYIVLSPATDG